MNVYLCFFLPPLQVFLLSISAVVYTYLEIKSVVQSRVLLAIQLAEGHPHLIADDRRHFPDGATTIVKMQMLFEDNKC